MGPDRHAAAERKPRLVHARSYHHRRCAVGPRLCALAETALPAARSIRTRMGGAAGAEEKIAADFGTVAMTVADEDMPDLPPLNVVVTPLKLPDAIIATYKTMARELFARIEGRSIEAASPLIATGKLAQLANGLDRKSD